MIGSKKRKNLQPWLDYFTVLQEYEARGFLDVQKEKNEAYITESALHSLSGSSADIVSIVHEDPLRAKSLLARDALRTARRIRAYAGWRSKKGEAFLAEPFALHVVGDEYPYTPKYTLLITSRRRWWMPWTVTDHVEIVEYEE